MKKQQLIFVLSILTVCALVSCGGGNGTSSGVSKRSLFGNIPGYFETEYIGMITELNEAVKADGKEEAEAALKKLEGFSDEVKKGMQPMADKIVGNKVAYSLSDSLPYQIVSDIEIEKVSLPAFALGVRNAISVKLSTSFDAVVSQPANNLQLYYFIMDDDKPIYYGSTQSYNASAAGDTLHVKEIIISPDAPAKYIKGCNSLLFVTESRYEAEKKAMDEQLKVWSEERKKELGIEE